LLIIKALSKKVTRPIRTILGKRRGGGKTARAVQWRDGTGLSCMEKRVWNQGNAEAVARSPF